MPVSIKVGVPPRKQILVLKRLRRSRPFSLARVVAAAQAGRASLKFAADIPSTWDLVPLLNLAASLAIGTGAPAPVIEGTYPGLEPFVSYLDNWDDGRSLRYSHLVLGTTEGLLVPTPFHRLSQEAKAPLVGSSHRVREDCLELARVLGLRNRDRRTIAGIAADGIGARRLSIAEPYRLETFSCVVLAAAAEVSIQARLPVFMTPYYPLPRVDQPITYETADFLGFGSIAKAAATDRGQMLRIEFANGYSYQLPLTYLLAWYKLPSSASSTTARIRAVRRLTRLDGVVRICLVDGRTIDILGSNLLELCEPSYELFGGGTKESRRLARRWLDKAGPFRTFPIYREESEG